MTISKTKSFVHWKPRLLLHLCAFAVIGVSAVANVRYGLTLGTTGFEKILYALMSGASDGFKAVCLPLLLASLASHNYLRAVAIVFLLPIVICFSWVSAIGFAASTSSEAISNREYAITQHNQLTSEIKSASNKLDKLARYPAGKPLAAIEAELQNPTNIDPVIWRRTQGCKDVTLPQSISECRKYNDLKLEHVIAKERLRLEQLIRSNQNGLNTLGPLQSKTSDPGANAIRVYLGALGLQLETSQIRAWLSFLVMGLLEVGSLTGLLIADGMRSRPMSPINSKHVPVSQTHEPNQRSRTTNNVGLNVEQIVIRKLAEAGGIVHGTQRELSKMLGLTSKSTLHRTIHRLADKGLIALDTCRKSGTRISLIAQSETTLPGIII